jgi:anti-sigma factor RsiW
MTHEDRHHDDLHELLVPYALGELDPSEQARVEVALDADPALRRELDEIEQAGSLLVAGGMRRQTAPPQLKGRVMAAVRAGADRSTAAPEAAPAAAPVVELPRTARARRRWFEAPAFSGALVAACVLLAVVTVNLSNDLDSTRDQLDQLEQAEPTRDDVPSTMPAAFQDATPYSVPTTQEFESTDGSLIRVSEDKWILAFRDVPEPANGKTWQVWTASSTGEIRNVAQWLTGDTQLVVLDSDDIVEVMVSYETGVEPAPAPTLDGVVADLKV